MIITKDIVEKMEQVNLLMAEVDRWIDENLNVDGSKHDHRTFLDEYKHSDYYQFTDKPTGREQFDGEYCEQHTSGIIEDSFYGYYYYPTENGNYFYFYYEL